MSTREKILQAAEQLFISQGFEATTLRQITMAAGVNLAAVNYHFGTKETLLQELFKLRLRRLNEERLYALDCLEKQAGDKPIKPTKIVDAFFGTLLRMAQSDPQTGANFLKLLGRTRTEPSEFIRTFLAAEYEEVLTRYKEALIRSLPAVPRDEILWRFHFMLGATAYAIAGTDSPKLLDENPLSTKSKTRVGADQLDFDRLLPRLMNFLIGGLRAPLPEFDARTHQPASVRQAALTISKTSRTQSSATKGRF
jgi:AcrR family transcriptional regulator